MDKHHAIRVAVRGLVGVARERAINRLLMNPHLIKEAMGQRLHPVRGRGTTTTAARIGGPRQAPRVGRWVGVSIRLTPEQFILLRDQARDSGKTIAELIRFTLGLT